VRLVTGETTLTENLEVGIWPGLSSTEADLRAQHELASRISARLEELYRGLGTVRDLRAQIEATTRRLDDAGIDAPDVAAAAATLKEKLGALEEQLTQTKSKSPQDPLNYPPRLDNQFVALLAYVSGGDHRPTAGAHARLADLEPELEAILAELRALVASDVEALNASVRALDPPALVVSDDG
jgi:uncharacterized protein involved in exopolysaccharide biosynthesis